MRWVLFSITLLLGPLMILSGTHRAAAQLQEQGSGRDTQFEQEILDRLGAISPEAVPLFQQATQAMDAGQNAEAKSGYEKVLRLAPGFPDAERRLSYVESRLGNNESAVKHAQNAFDADPSSYNHLAIAEALLDRGTPADQQSAYVHAQAAVAALPDEFDANYALMWSAGLTHHVEEARQANAKILALDPKFAVGHYFAGLLAVEDQQWEKAEKELLLSQQLGMPAEAVEAALNTGIRSQARIYRTIRWGGYTLAGWLVGFFFLFLAGGVLSGMTLRAVRQPRPAAEFKVGRLERLVRSVYRLVIVVTSAYYYLSIPMLILLVIGGAGGLIYLFFAIGSVPLQLALFIGVFALYTVFVVVRSILIRVKEDEPGRSVGRDEAPALWSLAQEVATRVGTPPVDAIYITPASEVAVTERGSLLKKLSGSGQRCLILGLGALNGMEQGQFKAILAHEYGHFINRDTAGGNFARQVQRSVYLMGVNLARLGLATWYNPAWLFVNGFYRTFLRITLGASRLQEILADRYSALTYGVRNFVDGLTHIARQSILFDFQVGAEVQGARQSGSRLSNLYSLPLPQAGETQTSLENKMAEALKRPTGLYDSHPSLHDRIELVEKAGVGPAWGEAGDRVPVWDLLPNAVALQDEMTAIVQANVDKQTSK